MSMCRILHGIWPIRLLHTFAGVRNFESSTRSQGLLAPGSAEHQPKPETRTYLSLLYYSIYVLKYATSSPFIALPCPALTLPNLSW